MAAALVDPGGRVLIQQRAAGAHLGGLWEFPGGKLEPGEDRRAGLARELHEELGVRPTAMTPLIAIPHDYVDKRVLLDVWTVRAWRGEAHGREAQPLAWVAPGDLHRYRFPAADRPVLAALSLPETCLVTPAPGPDPQPWFEALCQAARSGVSLIQVRAPGMDTRALVELTRTAAARLAEAAPATKLVVNGDPGVALESGVHGVHLNSNRLWQLQRRPSGLLVGASCHDAAELERAGALGLDYAFLSPVQATATHPGAQPLGWAAFETLVARATLPVYALGGLTPADVERARNAGGQGIAALRGLWWS